MAAETFTSISGQEVPVETQLAADIKAGKSVSFNRKKGNCLACHAIEGGAAAGTIGPPLMQMKMRFPDKAVLRAQIEDATQMNPNTMMPPFGAHKILSDKEISQIVEFIYSL
ncbi:sulfur oxidation c-type cytochrome SoxX [Solemya pervernicosa gill symbiont]|uniref:Sulfur oxidation c-type cytochrome SoxX n=3 Tax=Gammaproteobacteria incertae sedis TaxID=118884 RepID=A0A1T2LBC5_9GAMM|nr:sulfur oxidation c-type cytochrome SoxX [Solemya pervernicosa gill symbiont]QKQ28149.1 sulfur oxidation c-type cytochrome SoxX [Candidatus Reidiella endopervernicosa]